MFKKNQFVEIKPISPELKKYGQTNPSWLKSNEVVQLLNDIPSNAGHNSVVYVKRKNGEEETVLVHQIVKKVKSSITNEQKQKFKQLLKPIVMQLKEELKDGGTVPGRTRFTIKESFKQIRRMMEMLEQRVDDNTLQDEDYHNAMDSIRKKLDQMDNALKSHITGR